MYVIMNNGSVYETNPPRRRDRVRPSLHDPDSTAWITRPGQHGPARRGGLLSSGCRAARARGPPTSRTSQLSPAPDSPRVTQTHSESPGVSRGGRQCHSWAGGRRPAVYNALGMSGEASTRRSYHLILIVVDTIRSSRPVWSSPQSAIASHYTMHININTRLQLYGLQYTTATARLPFDI